jgi:hypothetical protein
MLRWPCSSFSSRGLLVIHGDLTHFIRAAHWRATKPQVTCPTLSSSNSSMPRTATCALLQQNPRFPYPRVAGIVHAGAQAARQEAPRLRQSTENPLRSSRLRLPPLPLRATDRAHPQLPRLAQAPGQNARRSRKASNRDSAGIATAQGLSPTSQVAHDRAGQNRLSGTNARNQPVRRSTPRPASAYWQWQSSPRGALAADRTGKRQW